MLRDNVFPVDQLLLERRFVSLGSRGGVPISSRASSTILVRNVGLTGRPARVVGADVVARGAVLVLVLAIRRPRGPVRLQLRAVVRLVMEARLALVGLGTMANVPPMGRPAQMLLASLRTVS